MKYSENSDEIEVNFESTIEVFNWGVLDAPVWDHRAVGWSYD